MELGISRRVAMVAAGTKGIGLASAIALRDEGVLVSVCGRSTPDQLPDGLDYVRCDVSSLSDLEAWHASVASRIGPVDVLVTNTGGPPAATWTHATDDQWRLGFDSTLLNVVRLVRLIAPGMRERKWGRIVHVTSLVAKQPHELLAISSTIRSGLLALTRLQATELAPHGVTVNAVLPGHTLTDRQIHLAEIRAEREGTSVDEALAAQAASIPMGRIAEPSEIAAAVAFLSSQRASFITGVNLLVDGGATVGPG